MKNARVNETWGAVLSLKAEYGSLDFIESFTSNNRGLINKKGGSFLCCRLFRPLVT